MNLASRIHQHLHERHAEQTEQSGPAGPGARGSEVERHAAPFWVRHYDRLGQVVSLGRVDKLYGGTLDLVELKPDQALLDVGCGTGELVLLAEDRMSGAGTFVGIDTEPAMIRQAEQKAADRKRVSVFAIASADSIPYPDESFDIVSSSLVLHHLIPSQQEISLAEMHRLLRPGGRLVVVDINTARRSLASRLPGHRHLDRADPVREHIVEQLSDLGFPHVASGVHPLKALSYAVGVKA